MAAPEIRDGWSPDPFGRYDERFFVYGEPSRLVRTAGNEATDPHGTAPSPRDDAAVSRPVPDAHVQPVDPRVDAPVPRVPASGWAVFAALCAIGALCFVRGPLVGIALASLVPAVFGGFRFAGAVRAERRSRRAPAPSLPTVDLYEGPGDPFADGLPVSDDLDRLVEAAGVERVS
jgi:hypothetical protein